MSYEEREAAAEVRSTPGSATPPLFYHQRISSRAIAAERQAQYLYTVSLR